MTAPTTLEALAAEMREVNTGGKRGHPKYSCIIPSDDVLRWERAIRAHLAARPASDLEQRLRERAATLASWPMVEWDYDEWMTLPKLLLEAADALANQRDLAGVVSMLEADAQRLRTRTVELEQQLTTKRQLIEAVRNRESGELSALAELDEATARITELESDKATLAEQGAAHARRVWELEREMGTVTLNRDACAESRRCILEMYESGKARVAELERELAEWKGLCNESDHLGSLFQERAEALEAQVARVRALAASAFVVNELMIEQALAAPAQTSEPDETGPFGKEPHV